MKSLSWSDGREKKDKMVSRWLSCLAAWYRWSKKVWDCSLQVYLIVSLWRQQPSPSHPSAAVPRPVHLQHRATNISLLRLHSATQNNAIFSLHFGLCYLSPEPDLMLSLRPWAVTDGGGSILTPSVIQISTDFSNVLWWTSVDISVSRVHMLLLLSADGRSISYQEEKGAAWFT